MGIGQSSSLWWFRRRGLGFVLRIVFGFLVGFLLTRPVAGLRPLRERARSWGDEVGFTNFILSCCSIMVLLMFSFCLR
jgi:biotin transporter BioY